MNTIYFHLVGGAAGDMLLGSLIELGCPLTYLKKEWAKLDLEFEVSYKKLPGFHHGPAKKLEFRGPAFKRYSDIKKIIEQSRLKPAIKAAALEVYGKLAAAERKAHGTKGGAHFHHLGEIDAILEICGFFIARDYLKVTDCRVSVFPLGRPAPATLEILKGKKICPADFSWESVTPTAAAILAGLEQSEVPFSYEKHGRGWGEAGPKDYLEAYLEKDTLLHDRILKIEVNIDDMNLQAFEPAAQAFYKAGAKEVYFQPVTMKKFRPAIVLSLLCLEKDLTKIRRAIFKHTTTFGFRYRVWQRDKLDYTLVKRDSRLGRIGLRVSRDPAFPKERPEYDDCKKIASRKDMPIEKVWRETVRNFS
jgi:hypothetical protein